MTRRGDEKQDLNVSDLITAERRNYFAPEHCRPIRANKNICFQPTKENYTKAAMSATTEINFILFLQRQ
jgi:hypothetical protein